MLASVDPTSLLSDGFCIVPSVMQSAQVDRAIDAATRLKGAAHGIRNLLRVTAFRELADSQAIRALVEPFVGKRGRVVRGILFDKTPGANWNVAWHQDLSIAVRQRIDVPGFGPWSVKSGVVHVQPPRELLEQMLTVR